MFVGQCGCGFLFKVGFWETGTWVRVLILVLGGRGFESTTLFLGVVGFSPHFFWGWGGGGGGGGGGGESTSLFFWGDIFFLILFCLGGGGFTLIS